MATRKKIVVLTGAGISRESGIPTFRDTNGMWKKYDAMKLASVDGFNEDPQAVLDFYNARRKNLLEVEPNHAHKMLAELEKYHDVAIVTQNVDDLHERAGSSRVIHLHGELKKVTSSLSRFAPDCIKDYPLDVPIRLGDKAADGSQMRPFIVWFGESLGPEAEQAVILTENADIFVVIGTSLVVYPAAGLVNYAKSNVPKFLIDPGDMEDRLPQGFHHIQKTAVEGIDILLEEISPLLTTPNDVF